MNCIEEDSNQNVYICSNAYLHSKFQNWLSLLLKKYLDLGSLNLNFCSKISSTVCFTNLDQCSAVPTKRVLSLTHKLILVVGITMSMHGLYMSTQHLNETLEPFYRIRVCHSRCDEHTCERSHVLYHVSCNISKYTTFKPYTYPHFVYTC